jgi:glycosyltransferase involved in cell wall biosynthesis
MENSKISDNRLRVGIAALGSRLGSGGGLDVYVRELVSALADYSVKHEYKVFITVDFKKWQFRQWPENICFVTDEISPINYYIRLIEWKLIRKYRNLFRDLNQFILTRNIQNQIRKNQIDIMHYPATLIWHLQINARCILTFFDMQHEYYPEFFTKEQLRDRSAIYRPSVEKAERIIVPSQFTRDTLIEKYEIPEKKISLLPVGISESLHRAPSEDIERVVGKYNLPKNYIFYPANPWLHKNHACLMAALRIYHEKYDTELQLVLTGRIKNNVSISKYMAVAAGADKQVFDLGFIPSEDMPALYSGASLMIFPSLFEGFGIPLLEAMACGCPIAAANATSIPEVVGDAARLFDPMEPYDIAEAIHDVLLNHDFRSDLVEKGFRRVKQFYWSQIIPQLERIYTDVGK